MNKGFTLLELVITMAIAAILVMLAIPSLSTFVKNDRLSTQINTLISHLAYARNEAVSRSQQVVLCAGDAQGGCGGNWQSGWLLFVDEDSDTDFGAGDVLLREQTALTGGNTVTSDTDRVVYDFRGFSTSAESVSFSLCDDRGEDYAKSISISTTGRVKKQESHTCS